MGLFKYYAESQSKSVKFLILIVFAVFSGIGGKHVYDSITYERYEITQSFKYTKSYGSIDTILLEKKFMKIQELRLNFDNCQSNKECQKLDSALRVAHDMRVKKEKEGYVVYTIVMDNDKDEPLVYTNDEFYVEGVAEREYKRAQVIVDSLVAENNKLEKIESELHK